MGEALDVLPRPSRGAVGVAISPVPVIAVVLRLLSPRADDLHAFSANLTLTG